MASTRIVIIGGGFAGAHCAQALVRHRRRLDLDVLLIDRHDFFVFSPLLVEAGTGHVEPRHAVVPLRNFVGPTGFRMGEVTGVDLAQRQVQLAIAGGTVQQSVPYDQLVVAVGSVTRLPDVPGLHEHGFEIKSLSDAIGLRDRAIQMLEFSDAVGEPEQCQAWLHFVVVGGNFTGAEVAGELEVFFSQATRAYPRVRREDCRVTLIEIADRILPALDAELSAYAVRRLRRRGVDVRLQTSVREVLPDAVLLHDGERLATRTVIWCAGIAPSPLIAKLGLPLDERGYILCQPEMRVRGHERVWAIGDCAVNTSPEGLPYAATAQHAVQQGRQLARNLMRVIAGQAARPGRGKAKGTLVALGCRTGVARVFGVKLSGFLAWFLWRSVYLLKMPGLARKVRVLLDWTVALFFSRDYVQLGVHSRKARAVPRARAQRARRVTPIARRA